MKPSFLKTLAPAASVFLFKDYTKNQQEISTIAATSKLPPYLKKSNPNLDIVSFGAGLPDAPYHPMAKQMMDDVMADKPSKYAKYYTQPEKNPRGLVTENIKSFIEENLHYKADKKDIRFIPGSSLAIDALPNEIASSITTFGPVYPNLKASANRGGVHIDSEAKIEPGVGGRWQLQLDKFAQSLQKAREEDAAQLLDNFESYRQKKPRAIYLNFPHNPTGYSPNKEEYCVLVNILKDDLKQRIKDDLKLVVVAEDSAYAMMMHDKDKEFWGVFRTIEHLKTSADDIDDVLLDELRNNSMDIHSFSKDLSCAAVRSAYIYSPNQEILNKFDLLMDLTMISPPISSIAFTNGAIQAGLNKDAMQVYARRSELLIDALKEKFGEEVIPSKSDAGFFVLSDFSSLTGLKVTKDMQQKLEECKALIQDNPLLRDYYDSRLQDGMIGGSTPTKDSVAKDVASLMLISKGVATVASGDYIRFSVGDTNAQLIKESVEKISELKSEILANNPRKSVSEGSAFRLSSQELSK